MKNFLRTRHLLSNDDNVKPKKSELCSNDSSLDCATNNGASDKEQEWCCHSPLNEKNLVNQNELANNQGKLRTFLSNTTRLSPHLSSALPQYQVTPEKKSYGETFYRTSEIQKRPRLVKKCGELNIQMENVDKHKRRLFKDFFNTVIGFSSKNNSICIKL